MQFKICLIQFEAWQIMKVAAEKWNTDANTFSTWVITPIRMNPRLYSAQQSRNTVAAKHYISAVVMGH